MVRFDKIRSFNDAGMVYIRQTAKEVNAEALEFLKQRRQELPKETKFLDSLN